MRHIYLLVSKAGDGFKIGIAKDTKRRAKTLPEEIDEERSYEYPVKDGDAHRVERALHRLFREYRIPRPRGDGYTEWFDIDVLPRVKRIIDVHGASLMLERRRAPTGMAEEARLNIPLPADLHHLIRLQALEERESVAAITRRLWCEYLRRQGKTAPPA